MAAPAPAPAPDPVGVLSGIVGGLEHPALALVSATVLRPLELGPEVSATWALTRDIALALVVVILLYGIVRAQVGTALGIGGPAPWHLVPRMGMAVLGIALSLPLVRALLSLNNLLCTALQTASPGGAAGMVRPLAGAAALSLVPFLFSFASDALAALILIGLGILACSYLIRAAEIVLLTLLLPLAMALWLVPAASGAYRAVVGHLLVAIFTQTVQEVVLLVLATGFGRTTTGPGLDWLWAIAALTLLFRCRGLLSAAVQAASEWVPSPRQALGAVAPAVGVPGRAGARLWSWGDRARGLAGM